MSRPICLSTLKPYQFGGPGCGFPLLKNCTMSVPKRHVGATFGHDCGLESFNHAANIMGFVSASYCFAYMASLLYIHPPCLYMVDLSSLPYAPSVSPAAEIHSRCRFVYYPSCHFA